MAPNPVSVPTNPIPNLQRWRVTVQLHLGGRPIWNWLRSAAYSAQFVLFCQGKGEVTRWVPVTLSPPSQAIRSVIVTWLVHFDQLLYNCWHSPGQRCRKKVAMEGKGDDYILGHWGEFKVSVQSCPCPCPSCSTPHHTMRSQPFSQPWPLSVQSWFTHTPPPSSPNPRSLILSCSPLPTTLLWVNSLELALST